MWLFSLLLGCPEVERTPFPCAWVHGDGAALDAHEAEVILGFQGLVHVELRATAPSDAPEVVEGSLRFVPDAGAPIQSFHPTLSLLPDGEGARSSDVVLFLLGSGTPADWDGVAGTLEARLQTDEEVCLFSAPLSLRDGDPCAGVDDPSQCEGGR